MQSSNIKLYKSFKQKVKIDFMSTHPIHLNIISGLRVKIELLNPCGTELFISIASSRVCASFQMQNEDFDLMRISIKTIHANGCNFMKKLP